MSLSICPPLLMLSSKVLTKCLSVFILHASVTRVLVPTKSCAQIEPFHTAGVSENTLSVETGSDLRFELKAGKCEI